MSGRVPCTQASVVWDLVAFLRRCETRVLEKPRMFKWPRGAARTGCSVELGCVVGWITLLAGHPPHFIGYVAEATDS